MGALTEMLVQGSLMAAVLIALRRPLLRLLPASFVRAAWIAVVLRLLLPLPTPISVAVLPQPLTAPASGIAPAPEGSPAQPPQLAAQAWTPSWADVVFAVWACVAVLLLARMVVRYALLLRSYRETLCEPEPVAKGWAAAAQGRAGRARLCVADVPAPLTLGVLRPVVVVPRGFGAGSSLEDEMAMTHEMVHVSRIDAALKLLFSVAACLWWFNPVVLIARSVAARDIELSCDEAVLAGRTSGDRRAYAVSLVSALAYSQPPRTLSAAAGFGTTARCMEERIARIKMPQPHLTPLGVAAALGVACALGLLSFSGLASSTPNEVHMQGYSFTVPPEWQGRVALYADDKSLTVYPIGHPELPLLSVFEVDPEAPLSSGDEGYRLFWRAYMDGKRIEAWAINYPSMTLADRWATAAAANPDYPGAAMEAEVINLCTGGAADAETLRASDTQTDDWESFYRDVVAAGLRVAE